ncbi:hypothetical protein FR731_23360 [Enterobacter hormaechei]|uniref:hypothetical protein n=1 Tax=Enterobacter hormaechei TaxID=158836 RepID=UPI0011B9D152|nr:hypothetical protein [Enterobacter hormaechei]TWX75250.1 hypothetical protein FR731_23360 [Enterobacter hormaechei]
MIFNGEMVRAILDGRKTQTRRIMKNQPAGDYPDTPALIRSVGNGFQWYGHYGESSIFNCPFGAVGDRIWVRETWAEAGAGAPDLKLYCANYPEHVPTHYENVPPANEIRWTPSIHMPRWASRLTLEITGVRVERLASVSDDDAGKEGYPANPAPYGGDMDKWLWFRQLWDSIYPDQSFKHNPWVWVIEFRRIEGDDHETD